MNKGDFSKRVVLLCIRVMVITLTWSMCLATLAMAFDKNLQINDILIFAGSFFGGELCLLALKRIFAKERDDDGDELDSDYQCGDSTDLSGDFGVSDSVDQDEDFRG